VPSLDILNKTFGIVGRRQLRVPVDDLLILLVAVIWGSSYVVMQIVGRHMPAATFLMLRFVCAMPVLAVAATRSIRKLTSDEVRTGIFFGCLLFGILILETVGVRYTSAANAGFLIAISVVLIPLFERVINKRHQLAIVYIMTTIALVGCGLLLLSNATRPRPGDFIILSAALIRAVQITLFGRRSRFPNQSLLNVTLIEFATVVIVAGLAAFIGARPPWHAITTINAEDWVLIVYLGVLGTSFAFLAQLRAARATSPTRVGLILSTEPVFATAFAITWAANVLSPLQILGGCVIIVAAIVGRSFEGRTRPAVASLRQAELVAHGHSGASYDDDCSRPLSTCGLSLCWPPISGRPRTA